MSEKISCFCMFKITGWLVGWLESKWEVKVKVEIEIEVEVKVKVEVEVEVDG